MYYIHTDFTSYFSLSKIINKKNDFIDHNSFIKFAVKSMQNDITKLFGKNIVLPVYNYDYSKSRVFNLNQDVSHCGYFTEFSRQKNLNIRSLIPVFSSITSNSELVKTKLEKKRFNAFDNNSDFSILLKKNGNIVNFGSIFSPTFIHYIEQFVGGVLYRYEKNFDGKIILSSNNTQKIKFSFHVQPLNLKIVYDLKKIEKDLIKEGILKTFNFEKKLIYQVANSNDFLNYSILKLNKDPYYFIDTKTQELLKSNKSTNYTKLKIEEFE